MLLASISRFLVMEQETLGLANGHPETIAFVESFLRQVEGDREP